RPLPHLGYISGVRIGLSQGQVYTGAYGSPTRQTYGLQGDKTNLAARLMAQAAPGEILCDDEIYRQAGRRGGVEALPPIRGKGKAGLIRVYRPTGAPAAASATAAGAAHDARLVGREPDVARLLASLDDLQAGQGRVIMIEGEAGIGKSRLVAELVQAARARG